MKKILLIAILALSTMQANAQANNSIDKIANAYLDLKNALVADNGKAAQSKAKILLADLSAQPDKSLKPDQQKLIATYLEKLKYDSRHISEVAVLDHQREHFANLSKNMYAVLKELKLNGATIYEQYCPMKKEYWLSETAAIRNPYYGKEMIECGDTKATLPAAK